MDETYIKQCDCPEIQGQWEPKEGDKYIKKWTVVPEIPDQPDYVCVPYFLRDNAQTIHKPSFVWLPRQEDIINMLPKRTTWFENLFRFYN